MNKQHEPTRALDELNPNAGHFWHYYDEGDMEGIKEILLQEVEQERAIRAPAIASMIVACDARRKTAPWARDPGARQCGGTPRDAPQRGT